MALSATTDYQAEESKSVGAEPQHYVAMMRTENKLTDLDSGTYTNTEKSAAYAWNTSTDTPEASIRCLREFNNVLYAGTGENGKIFYFDGTTWALSTDTGETNILSLEVYGSALYAGSGSSGIVYKFNGTLWSVSTDTGETNIYALKNYTFLNRLYAGAGATGKIFYFDSISWFESTDTGATNILSLEEYNNDLYAGSGNDGVVYKYDLDNSIQISTDIDISGIVNGLCVFNNVLYASLSLNANDIYYSSDGITWTISTDADRKPMVFCVFNNNLYYGRTGGSFGDIYYSSNGTTWSLATGFSGTTSVYSLAVFNNVLYAGTYTYSGGARIYYSSNGTTWTLATDNFPDDGCHNLLVFNNILYARTTASKIYYSSNGTTWSLATDLSVLALGGSGKTHHNACVFKNYLYIGSYINNGMIHRTSDGLNWELVSTFSEFAIASFGVYQNILYAGTYDSTYLLGNLYYSSDGITWTFHTALSNYSISSFCQFNNVLYIGTRDEGNSKIYKLNEFFAWSESTDTGHTEILSLHEFDSKLYAGTGSTGVILQLDVSTWTESTDLSETGIYSLEEHDNKLWAGTGAGGKVYYFDGTDWTLDTDTSESTIYSLCSFSVDNYLYAGTSADGQVIYRSASEEVIVLSTGQTSGNWVSAAKDSAHLTPNIIYDKLRWTETLNGGTVTVQLRTATTEGGLSAASYVAFTNASIYHVLSNYRWYQVKVSLTKVSDSPEVKNIYVRHKALIPRNDYKDLGSITYGVGNNFYNISAGNCNVSVANNLSQFDKYNTSAYTYNKNYRYKLFEIWSGFKLADSSLEWLNQFIGEIELIYAGTDIASITARDFIFHKLSSKRIGIPDITGTPRPYCSGKVYKLLCKEVNTVTFVYQFYCQQDVASIDAVYTRSTESQKWVVASPASTSAALKQVTFASNPGSEVAVDITINSTEHPCDIILDIITSEVGLTTDLYNAASFTTAKAVNSSLKVGVIFEDFTALEAINRLLVPLDGMIYIEEGTLKIKAYTSSMSGTAGQTFTESNYENIDFNCVIDDVENKFLVPYGNYQDDKTLMISGSNIISITNYGASQKSNFSFTYEDAVSIHSTDVSYYATSLIQYLERMKDEHEILSLNIFLEVLRTSIFDIIAVSNTKRNFSNKKFCVLEVTKDLTDNKGKIKGIVYADQ